MTEFEEEVALGAYAALPALSRSSNPDVARFARGTQEVVEKVALRVFLIEVMSWVLLAILIPYWVGLATAVVETHLTGGAVLVLVFGGGIVVPAVALLSRHLPLRLLCGVFMVFGLVLGIYGMTHTGIFVTPAGA